jgi:hypothetical protein
MRFFWKLPALVAGLAVSVLVLSSWTFVPTATGLLIDRVGRETVRLAEDASNVLNTELVSTVLIELGDTAEWNLLVDEIADIQSEQPLPRVGRVWPVEGIHHSRQTRAELRVSLRLPIGYRRP